MWPWRLPASKVRNGIEVCRKGCSDPDIDVFIFKIGWKNTNRRGEKNEIELEMRSPKGPDFEVRKMETRETQADDKDIESWATQKTSTLPLTAGKGFVKKPAMSLKKK
jgi:hypothetical protein